MTFTKTSQKFGQWSDVRANTVYGLGFPSEAELNKVSLYVTIAGCLICGGHRVFAGGKAACSAQSGAGNLLRFVTRYQAGGVCPFIAGVSLSSSRERPDKRADSRSGDADFALKSGDARRRRRRAQSGQDSGSPRKSRALENSGEKCTLSRAFLLKSSSSQKFLMFRIVW